MAKKTKIEQAEIEAYNRALEDAAHLADILRTSGNVIGDLPSAIRRLMKDQ
jgi:hypothetical protein